jgi:hypothetical protein
VQVFFLRIISSILKDHALHKHLQYLPSWSSHSPKENMRTFCWSTVQFCLSTIYNDKLKATVSIAFRSVLCQHSRKLFGKKILCKTRAMRHSAGQANISANSKQKSKIF